MTNPPTQQGVHGNVGMLYPGKAPLGPSYESEVVSPWTPIHVSKANEQYVAMSLQLDRALEAQDWQLAATLSHAMEARAKAVNGMYGR